MTRRKAGHKPRRHTTVRTGRTSRRLRQQTKTRDERRIQRQT